MLRETERIGWRVHRQHDARYMAPLKQLVPREPHKLLGLIPASVKSAVVMEFEEQLIVFRIVYAPIAQLE